MTSGIIRRIIKFERTADGRLVRTEMRDERRSRKKIDDKYRGVHRTLRKMMRAHGRFATEYLARHDRSNRKKKNGFVKDLRKNISASYRKGKKALD